MKNLEQEIAYFLNNGVEEVLALAKKYSQDLLRKYESRHIECKRAEKIVTSLDLIREGWQEMARDYQNISEHILTPETHVAGACLRRQRQHLRGRSEESAQELYFHINRLLPVLSAFEGRERSRRQSTLFAIERSRKNER